MKVKSTLFSSTEYMTDSISGLSLDTIAEEDRINQHLRSVKKIIRENGTDAESDIPSNDDNIAFPINRIYPHIFDEEGEAGRVLILIRAALTDAQLALDAYGAPDITEMSTRLNYIASFMGKAHSLTTFNESLGSVVSFIRRAMLLTDHMVVTRSSLNALLLVLRSMIDNPMLDLDDASDFIDSLSSEGWRGEHPGTNDLVAALLDFFDSNHTDKAGSSDIVHALTVGQ